MIHGPTIRRHRLVVAKQNGAPVPRAPLLPYYVLAYGVACSIGAGVLWRIRPELFMEAPAILLLLLAVSIALALGCAGQWYVHHQFPDHDFVQHNEVGGFIIAVTGSLYAVMLGFLTVVGWQHFADAQQLVALESAAAGDVWHAAIGLPATERARVRRDTLRYATLMVQNEWPKMRSGSFDTEADVVVMDAITAAGAFRPADFMESNSQNATLQQLSTLHDMRQRRLAYNEGGIKGFEWLVLAVGAVCVVCLCWLFGLRNTSVHLFMTASVTVTITSMLVLLFELQYPFRTDLRIAPVSWLATINHIHLMQAGSQMRMRM